MVNKNSHAGDPRIVVIGGGTGSFTLLSELKKHTRNLTALVNMADDGGSTGILRDELGVLPPGDVRQCLVALSNSPELRALFNFRFPGGTFAGHSFGNLFLSAAEQRAGSFASAVKLSSKILNITGQVIPITLDDCQLVLTSGRRRIVGERKITNKDLSKIGRPQLTLEPLATLNPDASVAIAEADLIVVAPGNLYGSLAPALLTNGLAEALAAASAPVAYVANLVNKAKQTPDFYVHDYVAELERFTRADIVDFVLYNTDVPDNGLLKKYALEDEFPVKIDEGRLAEDNYQAIGGKFLARGELKRDASDKFIRRSLIRHNASAITSELLKLC